MIFFDRIETNFEEFFGFRQFRHCFERNYLSSCLLFKSQEFDLS